MCNDQLALVRLLNPEGNIYGLRVLALDEEWNYRGNGSERILPQDLKIEHSVKLKNRAKLRTRGAARFVIRSIAKRILGRKR